MCHKFPVLTVKKLLKSVSIYGSYRKNKTGVPFFGTPCIVSQLRYPVQVGYMYRWAHDDGDIINGNGRGGTWNPFVLARYRCKVQTNAGTMRNMRAYAAHLESVLRINVIIVNGPPLAAIRSKILFKSLLLGMHLVSVKSLKWAKS